MKQYYFGYGSNLNQQDLRDWSNDRWQGTFLGRAELPDYRLDFNYYSGSRGGGALNLMPERGCQVLGGLFEVSPSDLQLLDRKEGAPIFYRRTTVQVWLGGEWLEAITYEVIEARRREFCPPTDDYVRLVKEAYQQLDLPEEGLVAAIQAEPQRCDGLFVYGTLMSGEFRHSCLSPWTPDECATGTVWGELFDLGSFPGLKWAEPPLQVQGEFLHYDDILEVLGRLDPVEGNGHLYQRRVVEVRLGDGSRRLAWTYFYLGEAERRIDSGDWRQA